MTTWLPRRAASEPLSTRIGCTTHRTRGGVGLRWLPLDPNSLSNPAPAILYVLVRMQVPVVTRRQWRRLDWTLRAIYATCCELYKCCLEAHNGWKIFASGSQSRER